MKEENFCCQNWKTVSKGIHHPHLFHTEALFSCVYRESDSIMCIGFSLQIVHTPTQSLKITYMFHWWMNEETLYAPWSYTSITLYHIKGEACHLFMLKYFLLPSLPIISCLGETDKWKRALFLKLWLLVPLMTQNLHA